MNKDLEKMTKELAKLVIQEIVMQQKDKRLHNTRLLMKNYNKLKDHMENVNENIDNLDIEVDRIEDSVWISSIARSKIRTAKMIGYLESAMSIVENNMKDKREEYKYKAFELFYIDKKTNEEIQEALGCGKNSPKLWSDAVINELNVLLWGIEALGF